MLKRELVCKKCGTIQEIWSYRRREKGHIKHLWCFICKETLPFLELDNYEKKYISVSWHKEPSKKELKARKELEERLKIGL